MKAYLSQFGAVFILGSVMAVVAYVMVMGWASPDNPFEVQDIAKTAMLKLALLSWFFLFIGMLCNSLREDVQENEH
jgi:hypothetical protein